jgi:hypothetical protein
VLVHCFAGCSHTEILAKLGLSRRDLFAGPPPTKEQLATLRAEQRAGEAVRREQRGWLREAYERERKFGAAAAALIGKLVRAPEDAALARMYHRAVEQERWWRIEAERREAQVLQSARKRRDE